MRNRDPSARSKWTRGDIAHSVAKTLLSAIPGIGGPAAEIFGAILLPPLMRRRAEWIDSMAERLLMVERQVKGFKIKELSNNDKFITTITHATQVAVRNHQKEILEALRNAVLNAALPNAPEEDLQLMFLNFVDTLTSWHLRVLKFFNDPRAWPEKWDFLYPDVSTGSAAKLLEARFPKLRGRRDFYDQLVKDLFNRGLMNTDSLHVTTAGLGIFASRTTDLGRRFVEFITSPLKDHNEEPTE